MATNPLAPNPETDIDNPEVHQPINPIEDDDRERPEGEFDEPAREINTPDRQPDML
jgi:hypothetical protein